MDDELCIRYKVISLLSACLSVTDRVGEGLDLVEDLNADSLEIMEIIVSINEVFGIELSSDEIVGWRAVGQVVDSVVKALKAGEREGWSNLI